jgi:hypothetical protein
LLRSCFPNGYLNHGYFLRPETIQFFYENREGTVCAYLSLTNRSKSQNFLGKRKITSRPMGYFLTSSVLHTSQKKGAPPLFPAEKAISTPLKGAPLFKKISPKNLFKISFPPLLTQKLWRTLTRDIPP